MRFLCIGLSERCGLWGWYGCLLFHHVGPLTVEIYECSQVGFPWLDVVWVHRNFLFPVGVFVAEPSEGMAELMHDDGFECRVVSHRQVVGVEYASAPVVVGVHQHDDVFVWGSREPVVEVFQVECRQVSVAVGGVEVGVQCGVFPYSPAGFRCSALF